MNVLDLFSGIGGFSLGVERAGMRTVAFCEIDPYCRRVLAKNFPGVPCYDDVRTLTGPRIFADGIFVDVVTAGWPCQDISVAGNGAGLDGARSGRWSECARILGEVRPRYVIVENVAALLGRGLSRVLGDLAALGFDAEWHCIPASAVGAPHRRDRVWIIAYRDGGGRQSERLAQHDEQQGTSGDEPHRLRVPGRRNGAGVADAVAPRLPISECLAAFTAQREHQGRHGSEQRAASECGWWGTEPDVGRVAHGVPQRVDRLRALGNSLVPQIPEIIGRAIMRVEHARDATVDEATHGR